MARKFPMMRSSHRLKLVITFLVGIVVLFASHQVMLPPNLIPVAVLTASVPAQTAIPATDIQWVATDHPPSSVLTQSQSNLLATLVPNQALPAGASIPIATLVPPGTATTLNAGEIPWSVTVSGAAATYFSLGSRVSVWAPLGSSASPVLIAEGVRVIGMYNSAGTTVSPTPGDLATAPSTLSLAVPQADLQTFLGLTSPTVEPDSNAPHFVLNEGGTIASTSGSTGSAGAPGMTASGVSGQSSGGTAPSSTGTVPQGSPTSRTTSTRSSSRARSTKPPSPTPAKPSKAS